MPAQSRGSAILIRPASPADLDFLQQLENRAFNGDRISRRSFGRFVRSPSAAVLVCERRGEPAGYAAVLFRSKSRAARLYSIGVLPDSAGEGLGAGLLKAAEQLAAERGASSIHLEVRPDNVRAIRLYDNFGYRLTGAKARYYEDGAPAYRLTKSFPACTTAVALPLRSGMSGAV